MKVVNALQVKNGAKVDKENRISNLSQPVQMIPNKDKDHDWVASDRDWETTFII